LETLETIGEHLTSHCILGVDANAQVGDIEVSNAGGAHSFGDTDERGMLFIAWLSEHRLLDAHSFLTRTESE
jgi:hypothetical protein